MLEIITPRPAQSGKFKATSDVPATHELANGETPTHYEAPTKIRYPTKRMTIGEMRKRVRNLLEFVGRVQGEEDKRGERAKLLELGVASVAVVSSEEPAQEPTEAGKVGESRDVTTETMEIDKEPEPVAEGKPDQVVDAKTEAVGDQPLPMSVDETAALVPTAESGVTKVNPADNTNLNGESSQTAEPVESQHPPAEVSPEKTDTPGDVEMTTAAAENPSEPSTTLPVEEATVPPPTAPAAVSTEPAQPPQSKSSQLLAELTSDLIRFQMMFEVGGSVFAAPQGMNGGGGDEE
jgi:hypothetical protein